MRGGCASHQGAFSSRVRGENGNFRALLANLDYPYGVGRVELNWT